MSCWGYDYITEYLIQWKSYESEFDIWYNMKNLREAKKLIKKYEECTAEKQKEVLL